MSQQSLTAIGICDMCSKKVDFTELKKMNVYSDFEICQNCKGVF